MERGKFKLKHRRNSRWVSAYLMDRLNVSPAANDMVAVIVAAEAKRDKKTGLMS